MSDPRGDPSNLSDPLAGALQWDYGTAYDLLLSASTLLRPKVYGLPAPWAAGVRKRLTPQSQTDFKSFYALPFGFLAYTPIHLVLEMGAPKSAARFLDYVEAIPDPDFSKHMHVPHMSDDTMAQITYKVLDGGKPTGAEIEEYRKAVGRTRVLSTPSAAETHKVFSEMANPAETKKRWLSVMREYHSVFFTEEEERLEPVLKRMLDDAQALSRSTTVTDLIERLSNGFTISQESILQKLVLAPSVWCHPFVMNFKLSKRELLLAWGAHPTGYKLAPGESVPDQALLVLRALGDPTRLRLLRLLASEPRTPQALARELKLSLPTVSHHMRELRAAGLVRLELGLVEKGRENKYTVRWQSAERAFGDLGRFVLVDGERDA